MFKILILTEKIANENTFHEKLQRLDYETFVSSSVLRDWRTGQTIDDWIEYFSLLIISETIADADALSLLKATKEKNILLLRKLDESPSKEEKTKLDAQGFSDWIFSQASLVELRECIFFLKKLEQATTGNLSLHQDTNLHKLMTTFRAKLSPITKQIFIELEKQKGHTISREQLSNQIWGYCNNSTLSQLSSRIKSIKRNILDVFNYDNAINTDWKSGYRFSNDFYHDVIKKCDN